MARWTVGRPGQRSGPSRVRYAEGGRRRFASLSAQVVKVPEARVVRPPARGNLESRLSLIGKGLGSGCLGSGEAGLRPGLHRAVNRE